MCSLPLPLLHIPLSQEGGCFNENRLRYKTWYTDHVSACLMFSQNKNLIHLVSDQIVATDVCLTCGFVKWKIHSHSIFHG